MKPALVFPYNDPDGMMFPHLQNILPDLKDHFDHAYIAPPLSTFEWFQQKKLILADTFFTVFPTADELPIGKQFAELYQRASTKAPAAQALHLCFPDRLCFALETNYRESFLADIDALSVTDLPLVFERSTYAWETHPQNYRELEGFVTTVGKNLFGRELDYAWCHLVVQASQLKEIIPHVKNLNISMVAEIIYYLQSEVNARAVDWLAWEDPFIFERDAKELKLERENSLAETNKRLNYVLPMLETLTRLSRSGNQ